MKRFVALYFLYLAGLFAVFYADTSSLSVMLNTKQTGLTLFLLEKFLSPGQINGIDILINPHYKIIISQACNGMIPILFLYASILAYPSRIWHKVLWMFIGYCIFVAANVGRILMVVYFVEQNGGRANFHWSHDLLGNALLMAVGLGLFISFIQTSGKMLKAV